MGQYGSVALTRCGSRRTRRRGSKAVGGCKREGPRGDVSLERLIVSARSVAGSVTEIHRVAAQDTAGYANAALKYAERGWPVIPLHCPAASGCSCSKADCQSPGKHPRTKSGLKDATCDPATVREWWNLWPNANVGIVTGPESGLFVLDVDGEQGEQSLMDLEQRHGELPETLTVLSGGGGRHLYFLCERALEVRNSQSKIAPRLDIRGQGGFVVAPPSRHASGTWYQYENADTPIVRAPDWLLRLLAGLERPPTDQTRGELASIPSGQRTPALFRRGCSLRARGAEKNAIESDLLWMNRERCDPPHDESKIRKIAAEICEQYSPSPVRVDASQPLREFLEAARQENNLEFMQRNQRAKWRSPLFLFTRWVKGRPEFSGMEPSQAARRIEQELGVEFWERFAGGSVCADPRVQFIAEWDLVRSPAGTGGALVLAWEQAQKVALVPPNSYSPQYANCISLLGALQRRAGEGRRFPAPQKLIGKLLGVDHTTIGLYIKLAIKDNLLKVVKEAVPRQLAKEYILDLSQLRKSGGSPPESPEVSETPEVSESPDHQYCSGVLGDPEDPGDPEDLGDLVV